MVFVSSYGVWSGQKPSPNYRISYADAFAVAAAVSRNLTIVTGDPELFALETEAALE